MKYINTRDGFLSKKKTFFDSLILEESGPFANEIPWGDSLVGRLINSFRRKAGIGYNLTKVKSLLDSFKAELDMLIASSLSRDTQNEFDVLRLKNIFHDLREQCTNDVDDPTKLNTLIGGNQNLWNNQQQNGGDWANVLTHGILVDAHDFIQNTMDKETLDKAGIPRDGLLDNMTILIDDLRRLTVSQGNTVVGRRGFPLNFSNLVNSLSNVNENFILGGYYDFIFETGNSKQRRTQRRADERNGVTQQQGTQSTAIVTTGTNQQGNVTPIGASASPDARPKGTNLPANQQGTQSTGNSTIVTTNQQDKAVATNISKIKLLKQLAIQLVSNLQELDTEEKILNNQTAQRFLLVVKSLDENDLAQLSEKNKDLKIKIDDRELTLSDAINIFSKSKEIEKIPGKAPAEKPTDKSEKEEVEEPGKTTIIKTDVKKEEPKKKEKEVQYTDYEEVNAGYKYSGYSPIYEATATFSTVEGAWDKFLEDSRLPDGWLNISQREIDKLVDLTNGYGTGNLPLNFNMQLHPDPIIGICRIFKRAHDLYFTPVIPSGRTNGKVSNLTYREYEKLGGVSGQSDPTSPGYGPWAVKKIREQWNDGVLAIIQDQKYRKILSNVRFIVPGSEDANNRTAESKLMRFTQFHKVFEAEANREPARGGQLGDDKKSHGQILFDFINDLLDNKTAADFDAQRRVLLRKYFEPFGFKLPKEDNLNPPGNRNLGPQIKPEEDAPDNSLVWERDTTALFTNKDYEGPIYVLPIKQSPTGHRIIFAHLLKKVTIHGFSDQSRVCYYVKFLFDSEKAIDKLINTAPEFRGFTKANSLDLLGGQNVSKVYYGIICLPNNSRKISIVYSNVNPGGNWDNINGGKDHFELLNGTGAGDINRTGGQAPLTVFRGKLHSKKAGTKTPVITKLINPILAEKSGHDSNLSMTPQTSTKYNNAKLMDALVEEAKNKFQ
jgi:hypothetical protein